MIVQTHHDGQQHRVPSEITPERVYRERRQLLQTLATGVAGAALASWAARDAKAQMATRPNKLAALPGGKSSVSGASVMENHVIRRREHLQQLLRVRHGQVRSRQKCPHAQDPALDGGN